MKKVVLSGLLGLLLFSCNKTQQVSNLPALTADEVSAARIWQRITEEEDYQKYPTWPGYKDFQMGQSPHGRFHKVFITPVLRNALPIADKKAPYGTIVVKENYTADKELAAFTVMAKVKGYDPENKDWFWAKYDAKGNVQVEGKLKKCADCHVGSNNDCLILWQLDRPVQE